MESLVAVLSVLGPAVSLVVPSLPPSLLHLLFFFDLHCLHPSRCVGGRLLDRVDLPLEGYHILGTPSFTTHDTARV